MLSIAIQFEKPLLLLLIIPFILATIIPYFTIKKRYRCTRNRILSMVLHGILSVLAVFMLTGMTFVKTEANPKNEIILLVDVSSTENKVEEARDEFLNTLIDQLRYGNINIGVVTFGFDCEYAVPFTRNYDKIVSKMNEVISDKEGCPDDSSTNIQDALLYAKSLFTPGNKGKIVLVTDGLETDGNARSVIRTLTANSITIDTVYISSFIEDRDDLQIVSINYPDYHLGVNEDFTITLDVYSTIDKEVTFTLSDNGEDGESVTEKILPGMNQISFTHQFSEDGIHEISVLSNIDEDFENLNNDYVSYYNVELFNKLLVLEHTEGESELFIEQLKIDNKYNVDLINVLTQDLPNKIEKLCEYDEIILNNIANDDLSTEFVELLHEYVYTYGGGLFTAGGKEDDGETAHAYNRQDLVGTLLQQMLPVQAINYTPPVGVVIIIDRSGSMGTTDDSGGTILEWARAGATSCLNALSERDYIGIMTLDSEYNTILEPTPRTEETKIISAIQSIDKPTGGTVFPGSIYRAGLALRALKDVEKKHIIIVSDGQVPASQAEEYEQYAKMFYETDGITISVVAVNMNKPYNHDQLVDESYPYDAIELNGAYNLMLRLTKISHGRLHVIGKDENERLVPEMREDLNAPEIKDVNYENFYPTMVDHTSSIYKGIEVYEDTVHTNKMNASLDGYYGVKVKNSAQTYLTGPYGVAIYSQWKYGNGMVGSFMCDLKGEWSESFVGNTNGNQFLYNAIDNLTPTENIRFNEIKLNLQTDNLINSLSIYTTLEEGQTLRGSIEKTNSSVAKVSLNELPKNNDAKILRKEATYVITNLSNENNYSRASFVIRTPGTYNITVEKLNKNGEVISSNTIYKEFAYSKEYDYLNYDEETLIKKLESLAKSGGGSYVQDLEDPNEVITTFDTTITKTFDPRVLFAIIIIIFFLTDIAIRKFKFKWPHELFRKKGM